MTIYAYAVLLATPNPRFACTQWTSRSGIVAELIYAGSSPPGSWSGTSTRSRRLKPWRSSRTYCRDIAWRASTVHAVEVKGHSRNKKFHFCMWTDYTKYAKICTIRKFPAIHYSMLKLHLNFFLSSSLSVHPAWALGEYKSRPSPLAQASSHLCRLIACMCWNDLALSCSLLIGYPQMHSQARTVRRKVSFFLVRI